jgi:hypothetical protein
MPHDQGTAAGGELVLRAAARPGPEAAIAAELLARTRAELPVLAGLGGPDELLAAAWLASLRSPRTRRAYAGDLAGWLAWLAVRGASVLDAGRMHADLWVAAQKDQGAEASTVRRRLAALSSFYATAPPTTWGTGSRSPGSPGRPLTRITPPPWAWPARRPAPWSRPPTADPRRCGPRR